MAAVVALPPLLYLGEAEEVELLPLASLVAGRLAGQAVARQVDFILQLHSRQRTLLLEEDVVA
jgi:hypothetical protein